MILSFLLMDISMFSVCSDTAYAGDKPMVTSEDCVKCHSEQIADVSAAGGKHKGVGCSGCHVGHPPAVEKPIPKCSQCHKGNSHFGLSGCLNCHRNPHTPLNISFSGNITDACLTCHTLQIAQLRKNKSKHSPLYCSRCHSVHRKLPQCTQCHKPHFAEMAAADCRNCHKPHMPKVVTYDDSIQSKDCGSCHKKAFDLLRAGGSKHSTFSCVFCHKEKHKMIPDCRDCHGSPHPDAMMSRFPKCGECHNVAHNLNNWPAAKKGEKKDAPGNKK